MALTLSAIILHRMDHTTGLWQPSYRLTEVAGDALATLRTQIRNNRDNTRAQQHKFVADPVGLVDDACRAILADPANVPRFIEQTQRIARHLLDSMVPGAAPGDLLACLYADTGGPPWLALLKMQAEKAYVQETFGSLATRDLGYRLAETTIFTSGVLQKCAFVAPAALRTPHRDLIVHDQQASPTDRENPIAAYFLKAFLGCAVPLTARQAAHRFRLATNRFVRDHRDILGPQVQHEVAAALRAEVQRPEIDLDDFARRHLPVVELRESYAQALLAEGIPGRVFRAEVGPPPARGPSLVFVGDHGLRLEIDEGALAPGIRSPDDTLDDRFGLYEIEPLGGKRRFVISTTRWDPVGRG